MPPLACDVPLHYAGRSCSNDSILFRPLEAHDRFDGGGAARRLFRDPEGAAPKAGEQTGGRADGRAEDGHTHTTGA